MGPKEARVTCVTQDATPATLQKTREDLHKRALLFMSFQLCSPALNYESSSRDHFANYRNKISKNKIQIQLVLAPADLAQQCTVIKSCLSFVSLFC